MTSILKTIADERAAIKARIAADQDRLSKLDQMEALARQLFPDSSPVATFQVVQTNLSGLLESGATLTKRERIYRAVEEILADGTRRTSRELERMLVERGVEVGGADPVNNLSAYLSSAEAKSRFESDRKQGGWMVIRPPKTTNPRGADTSRGFFTDSPTVPGSATRAAGFPQQ